MAHEELTPFNITPGAIRFNTDSMKLEYFRIGSEGGSTSSYAGIGTLAAGEWVQITTDSPDIQTGGTRAVFGGGGLTWPARQNVIQYINMSTTGDAVDFGTTMQEQSSGSYAMSSNTRGIFAGSYDGSPNHGSNLIQFFTFASTGTIADFNGDLSTTRRSGHSCSNQTRGIAAGGYDGGSPGRVNTIDYITMASTGVDAQDFGDLTTTILAGAAGNQVASSTRGIFAGGDTPTTIASMDFVTINTLGNAADFGDLNTARRSMMSASNATRGFVGGGTNPTMLSSIERIQLATLGSAVDSGDLSAAKQSGATSASSTRMVFAGGYAPAPTRINVIEYKQFASDGDVIDFGDLLAATVNITGMSNGHGGLG